MLDLSYEEALKLIDEIHYAVCNYSYMDYEALENIVKAFERRNINCGERSFKYPEWFIID